MAAPDLKMPDVVRAFIDSRIAEVHVALPGRIESYSSGDQKAAVMPLIKRVYRDGDVLSLPVISNVPVVWPAAGGASITFPMRAGDTVLLVFSERSLERWLSSGGEAEPGDPRKFDLNDAIAIPGLRFFGAGAQADNGDDVLLRYGSAKLRLTKAGKIALGTGGDELLDILSQFMGWAIATRTVGESEALTNQATVTALKAKVDGMKGAL